VKIVSFAFVLCSFCSLVFAEQSQKTALRYLTNARSALEAHEWRTAASYAQMGLSFDEQISDLWYFKAVAENALGEPRANVLESSFQAVNRNNWFDYNKDNARILYADALCDSHNEKTALELLSSVPALTSADAEYIRAKCYYHLGELDKAREKIDEAAKFYPDDARFPILFFKTEFVLYEDAPSYPASVRRLADYFIRSKERFVEYVSDDLEFYTALFARGEERKRMLKTYSSKGERNELFATIALQNELLSEIDALDYLLSFGELHKNTLEHFIPLLSEEEAKRELKERFSSYKGVIVDDTDSDGIDDFSVKYDSGRPSKIIWDKNQTGVDLWTIKCDYGTPISANIDGKALEVKWDIYPSIITATVRNDDFPETLVFNVLPDMLKWEPLSFVKSEIFASCDIDFYIPSVKRSEKIPTNAQFLASSSSYEQPSTERDNAKIVFMLYNGKIQFATYYDNSKVYARTHFKDGVPVLRIVDNTGNGIYETTELYGFAEGLQPDYYAIEDERQVMRNLFGYPSEKTHFYLKSVQVNDGNNINADYIEEYLPNNGRIASWDTNGDSKWNVRYYSVNNGNLTETMFYLEPWHILVKIDKERGTPVRISRGTVVRNVVKDDNTASLFWIGEKGSVEDSNLVVKSLDEKNEQGTSIILDMKDYRINAIKIGTYYYAEVVASDRDTELLRLADELNILEKK